MAYGLWGRVPLGNLLVTRLFFFAVSTRLLTRRAFNRLRGTAKLSASTLESAACREAVRKYLDSGYNKFSIGGGPKNLDGFVNVDFVAHNKVQREIVADVRDLSFIPSACASQVHSNHVLEHFSERELKHQLAEYARILRPDGILSVRCPNALGAAFGFWFPPVLETSREAFVHLGFPADESFCNPEDVWAHKDVFGVLHWFYGDVGSLGNEHLTLLTPTKLRTFLTDASFSVIAMTEPEALNLVAICKRRN